MNKSIALATILLSATGCSTNPPPLAVSALTAKIRVFHGVGVTIYPGKTCYGQSAGGVSVASGGFSFLAPNKKVGMPVTEDTPWSYHEYVISANEPLTLSMYLYSSTPGAVSVTQTCGPVGATLTPEAGKYYDTNMLLQSGRCSVQVRELTETSPGKATAQIKPISPAYACR